MNGPNPRAKFPLKGHDKLCFLNNVINMPNVEVGDYTYYDDFEKVDNFIKQVKYHFEFVGDRLVIGKFCAIGSGASFLMNGGNHLTTGISSYPFAIFGHGWDKAMEDKVYPQKGDTIIGNDVWIGHNATIMPGIKVGDGAVIAAYSVVVKDVEPYTIVGGNPSKLIKMRFDDEQIKRLTELQWWNWDVEKITTHINDLTGASLDFLD